ncbi:hypothetical protein RhiirA1_479322 [Rhizophagus irregularis]|uniref:Uncharacterized protein n=1 Tax=Rhizophagus irregularis TaxID=588596 RepID=A0A2N0QQT6_9GLOM|nr:hypothetical protein RhiirA1_479322 [Rhizophagus irregularis]
MPRSQLSCAKKDREVAIYWGSQFADNYDVLDREYKRMQDDLDKFKKEKEKLSDRMHQLGEEIRQLHSKKNELILQITRKDISLADAENKISIKSEEMQALQSKMKEEIQVYQIRAEELEQDISLALEELSEMESLQSRAENLEQDVSLAREELSEMQSFRRKLELKNAELFTKNIDLDLEKRDLEDTLIKKKDELVQMTKQIPKTSSESEVLGGVSGLEKEIRVMDSQSDTQKNQKTGLPPMKLRLLDMNEVTKHKSSRNIGHPAMT